MHSREITESIQRLAGTFMTDTVSLFIATVDSVNLSARTCDVTPVTENAETSFPDVMLAAENNDGVLIVPSIDSTVIVSVNKRGVAYVSMYSSIDTVTMIAPSGIQFQDGTYGGMVIIAKLVEKINRLEAAFNSHTHGGVTTGSSSTAVTATPITPITLQIELENTTVRHGK